MTITDTTASPSHAPAPVGTCDTCHHDGAAHQQPIGTNGRITGWACRATVHRTSGEPGHYTYPCRCPEHVPCVPPADIKGE